MKSEKWKKPKIVHLKVCSKCKRKLPLSSFYADRTKLSGLYNSCKECKDAYCVANKVRFNANSRKYDHEHREEITKRKRIYNKSERAKECMRKYNKSDKAKNKNKRYRLSDKGKATLQQKRILFRGLENFVKDGDIEKMLEIAIRCPMCMKKYNTKRTKTIDHVIPISKGGEHRTSNLQILCHSCNSGKGNRPLYLI